MYRIPEVSSVLGKEALLLLSLSGSEALGTPFQYTVEVLSEQDALDFNALLGEAMTISLELEDQTSREFNGVVTEFGHVGALGPYARYRAVLRPWLWLMGKRSNCRIFQHKKIPDVACDLFREHGFADFEIRLTETDRYKELDYLVQYHESDLSFVSRILEHEGIYYFFRHEKGRHILVLADSYSAHEPASGAETVPYFTPRLGQNFEMDHLDRWTYSRQVCSGAFVGRDFDFKNPRAGTTPQVKHPNPHPYADFELFEYPADFVDADQGTQRVRLRLEESQVEHEIAEADGNVRAIGAGNLFTLKGFSLEEQNKEHLIVAASYNVSVSGYEATSGSSPEMLYRMAIRAMDSKRPFRPIRRTPKPVVEGPQTAIVTGESSQDIWTDEFGRVKVQFHWDRVGKYNEDSSCWIRVSQLWAGSGFGGIHLPRIGQEVIVDFLEGDPDRPIITGRVYNEYNQPPYGLPQDRTQSGIKSRSSLKGAPSNFNEIRFEDKKGEEEVYIQAEKDQTTFIKNNQTVTVQVNQTVSVGANQTVSVGANQTVSVGGTRSVTVTKSDTQTFVDKRTVTVGKTDDLTITGVHTGKYDGTRNLTITGGDTVTVKQGTKFTDVDGEYNMKAKTQLKAEQAQNQLLLKGPQALLKNATCKVEMNGDVLTLSAPSKIVLDVGGNMISISSDGTIAISAKSKATLSAESGGAVKLDSAAAKISGPMVGVAADVNVEVTGALIKLN